MDDSEFVREVYDASYRRLTGQLIGITGSLVEAEDVVQEAFVRALHHARSFRRTQNPEAWLRVVAVNLARSRWRRVKHWSGLVPRLADPPSYDDQVADRMTLLNALRALPSSQREAIALHHIADLSVNEVAATLGIPVGTVKARLARGRAALAVLLADSRDPEANHA